MTAEEAAEEILRGPFRRCEQCKGTGAIGEVVQVHDEITCTICDACLGAGQLHRKEYVCAALFLNLKVPDYPQSILAFQDRVIERVSDRAMRNLLPKMRQNGVKVDWSTIDDVVKKWDPYTFQAPTQIRHMASFSPQCQNWRPKLPKDDKR
jgi:hypothetical protein